MSSPHSSSDSYREVIAAVVFSAAWADGSIGDEEKQALDRILIRLGYQRSEVMARIAEALRGPQLDPIEIPIEPEAGLIIMRYALAVTLADGMLSQDEVNFLVKLADHLGLDSATMSALGREAETLIGDRSARAPAGIAERVEALLPKSGPVRLPEAEVRHEPAARESVSEDAASRTALSRLVYQGDDFGGAIEL